MDVATHLLVVIALLGAFDVFYFHSYRGQLVLREASRLEAIIHVLRGFNYAVQLTVVPNLRLSGAYYLGFVVLFAIDIAIAMVDVWEEPRSRKSLGGLCQGEYLMHIVLSVLVGAYLFRVAEASWGWHAEPTALHVEGHGPLWLRMLAGALGLGSLLLALLETLVLWLRPGARPEPLHIRVRVHTSLERLWNVTQDHRLHPRLDLRFSRIMMEHELGAPHEAALGTPDPRIHTGTLMRYERDLGGLTVRGFGRYKLHKPMRQSSFQFWSDDLCSLIREGVGLWLYREVGEGQVELSTSFTYEVRWGLFGRLVDALVFRPLLQRLTERSFRRLAARELHDPRARVLGRRAGKPLRFEAA